MGKVLFRSGTKQRSDSGSEGIEELWVQILEHHHEFFGLVVTAGHDSSNQVLDISQLPEVLGGVIVIKDGAVGPTVFPVHVDEAQLL